MSDLTALHSKAKRLIISLREGVERLEVEQVRRPAQVHEHLHITERETCIQRVNGCCVQGPSSNSSSCPLLHVLSHLPRTPSHGNMVHGTAGTVYHHPCNCAAICTYDTASTSTRRA